MQDDNVIWSRKNVKSYGKREHGNVILHQWPGWSHLLPHIGNLYGKKMQSSTSTLAAQKLNSTMENLLDVVHGKLVLWNTKDDLIILQ